MKKRLFAWMLCLVLVLSVCGGWAESSWDFLGKPFPDFTATDTEGNTFTLSEVLKDHEAVLINFWATWCGPCLREFPMLNEVYEKYRDKVAFIALSTEENDTLEVISAYREDNQVILPMGRDENLELYRYIAAISIPTTVVVDRFGNAVFCQSGSFMSAEEPGRVLDAVLGEKYTETAVMDKIPRDTYTQAFPVSAARAVYPENRNYRKVLFSGGGYPVPMAGYIVPEDSVRLRIEIAADDDVGAMAYLDRVEGVMKDMKSLLDAERSVYVYDQPMPDPAEMQYTFVSLGNKEVEEGLEKTVHVFLLRSEESIEEVVSFLASQGDGEVRWEYAEEGEKAGNALGAYTVHIVDQDNRPVEGVIVNFCTDTACVPVESDEEGTISFAGAPDAYHVVIVDAPEGYSWDEGYEMYTPREYCEWILRVRKD